MLCGQSAQRAIQVVPGSSLNACDRWLDSLPIGILNTIMFDLNHRFQLFHCSASEGFVL